MTVPKTVLLTAPHSDSERNCKKKKHVKTHHRFLSDNTQLILRKLGDAKSSQTDDEPVAAKAKPKPRVIPPEKRVRWWSTRPQVPRVSEQEEFEVASKLLHLAVVFSYSVFFFFRYISQLCSSVGLWGNSEIRHERKEQTGFVPLYSFFEGVYTNHMYRSGSDIFARPISSIPGAMVKLLERSSKNNNFTFDYTGRTLDVLNLGSYNYLGFAENTSSCTKRAMQAITQYGISSCSSRQELGNQTIHAELERQVATFLGVEATMTFGMGFATNACNIPALVDKHCLIISDSLNHSSIIMGSRLSGATIVTFRHNDMADLERKIVAGIIKGHPKTRRPLKKIMIIVEGIYSMEGSIVKLREVLALKKKYRCYLYLDEAHSIGALGSHGGGVCEYWGIDPAEIDIMMGTFTKSFGSVGGYIAGSKTLVDHIRIRSQSAIYAASMSAPAAMQVVAALQTVMQVNSVFGTEDGQSRIKRLAMNSRYFRRKLKQMGFIVYGNDDSPVIPLMLYFPGKVMAFNRECLDHAIGVVTVAYPATPLCEGRVRFCMSAAHTKEQLDYALEVIDKLGDIHYLKMSDRLTDSTLDVQYC